MVRYPSNLVTGRQLRAARVLAGLTQSTLGAALGVDERQVRFWERRHHSKPSGARHHALIERALLDHGVILFAEPTPGARLVGEAGGGHWRGPLDEAFGNLKNQMRSAAAFFGTLNLLELLNKLPFRFEYSSSQWGEG